MIAAALLLFAVGCGSEPEQRIEEQACMRSAVKLINWSGAAADTVSARAEGPTCAQSIVTLTIRNSDGDPLWVFASTYYDMTVGGRTDEPAAVSAQEVDRFLATWVDVTTNSTSALPQWSEEAETLSQAADGLSYFTELDRETYESLRARDLPQLCFAAAVEASQCLVMDPQTRAPLAIAAYGI